MAGMLMAIGSFIKRTHLSICIAVGILLSGCVSMAHAQCGNPANAIIAENCNAGSDSSLWDVKPNQNDGLAGDSTIQGFATDISVNQGGTIYFKIDTPASAYTMTIYRMGYYQGLGARKIATVSPSVTLPQKQPACITDSTTGLYDCGNWGISASWTVPSTATSGIYFAHLVRTDTGGDSHILFIVRNDSSKSDIMYQTSDETWQAYNYYGGGSLYGPAQPSFDLTQRAYKVSYNRPFLTRNVYPEPDTYAFGAEFPMVEWLEQNGYDVTYTTGVDAARSGSLIQNHKIYMDSGHDEYWSGPHRASVQAARDAGVNLAFFAGNEMFWKTRWENSTDGTNTPYRTLVCYKETLAFAQIDPDDPPTWTGTWRDPSFSPPADGGKPENGLTGTLFMVNGPSAADNDGDLQIQVPAADGKMRFWRNTAAATLAPNATYKMAQGTLGYEWDEDIDNGARPAGAFQLSTATYPMTADLLLDFGGVYGAGIATHHMMMYRAPSKALVFSSGTVNWSWGLNSNHDNPFGVETPAPDINMQQATVNLFADMGVQPANLQSGLMKAVQTTDTTPPSSVISSPAAGATVAAGSTITVSGTATDSGGQVAGVEVSTNSGATWHPATGRGAWTYAWSPSSTGAASLMSRAADDSGNIETPRAPVSLTVNPATCPCTIWGSSAAPATADSGGNDSVELGLKFRADADGEVLGVRFYKSAANTGTHIGHLWNDSGSLLGTATFTGESGSGWQQVNFSSPIPVVANTTYIVSYYAPAGHYAADSFAFKQSGVDTPPLHALANGVDGANGVFGAAEGTFPNQSSLSTSSVNYWVDVVYTSSNTYSLSGAISGYGGAGSTLQLSGAETQTAVADTSGNYAFDGLINGNYSVVPSNPGVTFTPPKLSVAINSAVTTGNNFTAVVTNPMSISGTITGGAGATVQLEGSVSASITAGSSGTYSFTGLLNGTYTITPILTGTIFTPGTETVTIAGSSASGINFQGQQCDCTTIWLPSATPALIDSNDPSPVEVGVKFQADSNGDVTGLRFYKAATNTGTHIGHIWTDAGVLLGSATFSGESASGWQQVTFATPIPVAANTTYIASYFAPSGHYSADNGYFTTAVNSPPLHALANGVDGSNGVYLYSSSAGFPSNGANATNYWVDVLYTIPPSYTVSGTVSGSGGPGATVTLSGPTTATATANNSGNYSFAGIYSGSYFITPSNTNSAFLPGSQTITVNGANVAGVNFSTSPLCPCDTIWQPSATPTVIDSTEAPPVELGTRFDADSDGYILGVRFYKAPTNTGTHVGNLWLGDGSESLLATANFSGETASGWQQVMFTNPVPVTGSTTYVASYFAPLGHYSYTSSLFVSQGVNSPPLHALQDGVSGANGLFTYSSTTAYPASTFNSTGYWVDVIYAKASTFAIAGTITGNGSNGVTVTLSGPSQQTVTTSASGAYSFSGLADGTYTVTPTRAGVSFTPANQTVTINGGHSLSVNFVSGQPTYTVSGTVKGAPNDNVVLSGPITATAITDASGNYTFTSVVNGSYTVTPDNTGYTILPASQSVTVNGAPVSAVNFTATPIAYTISGTITGGGGATVTMTGTAAASTTADASGNYSFAMIFNGTYIITPAMPGMVFTPASTTVVIRGAIAANVNFTVPSNCPCDTIWTPAAQPTVVDSGDGQSVETGVKFTSDSVGYITGVRFYKSAANTGVHLGSLWGADGTLLSRATFTGESGSGWQQVLFSSPVPVMPNTTYVASYFSPGGHYSGDAGYFTTTGVNSPPLHALANNVAGSNGVYVYSLQSAFPSAGTNAPNFWVDTIFIPTSTYSISGIVSGAGGAGATVSLSGTAIAQTTASSTGQFTFNGLANGNYTVTVTNAAGYSFTPANQAVTINNSHVLGLSFTSTQTFSITGTISGSGGANVLVQLSGTSSASTTTNASGSYSFTGLAPGGYVLTPSSASATFTPSSQQVTINTTNQTANFTATSLTYAISGTISGAGGAGATVQLSGASSAMTTANAAGAFSFSSVVNGNYTVTPTNTGYSFAPPSQAVTVAGANQSVNFTASAQGYTITGTISGAGGAGATVALSGTTSATTTASASGTYTFTVANGTYSVTPSKAGYSFSPAITSVTISGANGSANFTSTALTYTITGTISGAGGAGATVTLSGPASATTTASASGTYTFSVANGTYSVTPSKAGYSFSPASTSVTISGANGSANFTSTALTYTITGTISDAGGAGATVTLSGAASATTTASASGTYTFSVANGTYSVTPSKAGYSFSPASTSVTISGANGSASFTSTALTYTITGTISGVGGAGATVTLSGAASATTTASASGSYTFSVANGTYSVTPSKAGYSFSPASTSVTISGVNASANFTSTALTYTITGTISGAGGSGATVTLSGAGSATTTATASGTYTFTVANGAYSVTPSKAGYSFSPANTSVTISGANGSANFTSTALTYTITGTISGAGGSGATVTLSGAASASTTASASGSYTFSVANGTYSVTPSKAGYSFSPASTSVTISGANASANFTSTALTYTITGTISGAGGSGATVTLSGTASATTTASASGTYTFSVANGTYSVTPSKSGYSYSPASTSVTISGASKTANFTATVATYTISGTIAGAGGAGATVKLSGASSATATASASGAYSFSGLQNGSYTVTPSRNGYVFTPSSTSVTISGANRTANFTATSPTYTISGTITSGAGATVTLAGAATATTTAGTGGTYSFTGLANGTYTVTPTESGFKFSPTSKSVRIAGANQTVNFTATALTFKLTGTISGPGKSKVTVTLTGAASATATTKSSGNYTFSGLPNGTYTVTATKAGYTMSPATISVTIGGADETADFTSARTTGQVIPLSDTEVAATVRGIGPISALGADGDSVSAEFLIVISNITRWQGL